MKKIYLLIIAINTAIITGLMIVMVVNHYSETEIDDTQDIMRNGSVDVVIMKSDRAAHKNIVYDSFDAALEQKTKNELTILLHVDDTLRVIERRNDGDLNYILIEKDGIQGWILENSIIKQ